MTNKPKDKKKHVGGRPKSKNPRNFGINVRLTADERAFLEEIAGKGGVGEYMRSLSLGRRPKLAHQIPAINQEAWTELSRTASNLNQLAYRFNSGDSVNTDEVSAALEECRNLLGDVRHILLTGRSLSKDES